MDEAARDAAGELHSGVASVVGVGKADDPVAGAVDDGDAKQAHVCSRLKPGDSQTYWRS